MENIHAVFLDFNGGVGDLIMYYYGLVRVKESKVVSSPDFQQLRHFKELYPKIKIFAAEGCYSQEVALDFLKYYPYIDFFIYRSYVKHDDIYNYNDRNRHEIWKERKNLKFGWITNQLTDNLNNKNVVLFNSLEVTHGLKLETDEPTLYVSKKDIEGISQFLGQEIITVHPFSASPFRSCDYIPEINGYNNFPSFSYAKLIHMLAERGKKVILLGSGNEGMELDEHPNIFDMCGKLNIRQSCYLVEKSSLFIGSNSCLSCIPFALKKPFIIFTPSYDLTGNDFGNNITQHRFRGPQLDIWLDSPRPKTMQIYYERPSVLVSINPSEVLVKAHELMSGMPPRNDPKKMNLVLR